MLRKVRILVILGSVYNKRNCRECFKWGGFKGFVVENSGFYEKVGFRGFLVKKLVKSRKEPGI